MKRHIHIALASSLLFTTLVATTATNNASAKENTTVETAATSKVVYNGFHFGDYGNLVRTKAKAKKWVLLEENYLGLFYQKKLYGHTAVIFMELKSNALQGVVISFNDSSKLTTWKKVQTYQKEMYRKLNKEFKYKKSTTKKQDGKIVTRWNLNNRIVQLIVGHNDARIVFSKK